MGLFRAVGRQVEQFKRTAQETADDTAEYRCGACETQLHADHDACPECGAADVVQTDVAE